MNMPHKRPIIQAFLFAGLSAFSCLAMQSTFSRRCDEKGQKAVFDAPHRAHLIEQLLARADTSHKNLPLPRAKAYELIEEAEMQHIVDKTS
jgi:hypothetical protein